MRDATDEPSTTPSRGRHYEMLLVATGVVLLAFLLEVRPDGRVAFSAWSSYAVPETCGARLWFGTTCPGCGLTRGLIRLARADWPSATAYHRLSGLLSFAILLQFPYRAACLRLGRPPFGPLLPRLFGSFLIAALVLNWAVDRCLTGTTPDGPQTPPATRPVTGSR